MLDCLLPTCYYAGGDSMENDTNNINSPDDGVQEEKSRSGKGRSKGNSGILSSIVDFLASLGLSELSIRILVNSLSIGLIVLVVWLMNSFYNPNLSAKGQAPVETLTPTEVADLPQVSEISLITAQNGITRNTFLHTNIPSRPRLDIIKYIVQSGDSVFGIAERFGLNPSTILWGNYNVLRDTPHSLRPDQELIILPTDGTYHQWQAGEGLNSVAKYYGVEPETIINYPSNNLELDTIGDFSNPNIPVDTWLIVPGGSRDFISWSAPVGITRDNPAIAQILGVGACGVVSGGAIGFGTFIWPADARYISGYDYSPETNHRGIDIAGNVGSPVYATDSGVIVYAGWNDYGYGYMIMIDHGNGWQSLYAHLSEITVVCSQSVGQGDGIGMIGNTGNSTGAHLHFELMHTEYGKVNPWNFLQ
ncbi:LysM peptidoglycan-binding domain-containing M23 family metallopeptidase [Chloroflexota bacterium]